VDPSREWERVRAAVSGTGDLPQLNFLQQETNAYLMADRFVGCVRVSGVDHRG
jgi:hypothetical protein